MLPDRDAGDAIIRRFLGMPMTETPDRARKTARRLRDPAADAGPRPDPNTGARAVPIFATTSYVSRTPIGGGVLQT